MRIALYTRISTDRKLKRQDPETQLLPLREYCQSRNWQIVQIYTDDVSAVKKRPQLEQMLRDAAMHKFDCLLVVKIDRIARSVIDFIHIMQALTSAGIRLIVTTQNIDTDQTDPAKRFLTNILVAVAEFERELISQRVKDGIARSKAQGTYKGGRKVVVVDKLKIKELRDQGCSIRDIAKQLKVKKGVVELRLKEQNASTTNSTNITTQTTMA